MESTLYIYDIKNLKSMQETLTKFRFCSIADFIRISGTVEELDKIDAEDINNIVVDITNLIIDGTYYRIFTERYLRTLSVNFDNIHFSLQANYYDLFNERFPYLFDAEEINYDFHTESKNDIVLNEKIEIHSPLKLFVYKNLDTIKKLYKNCNAISLSSLVEECGSIKYNFENINYTIIEKRIEYIDISSMIETLKLRRDFTFQFEILLHHIATTNNFKYCIEERLVKDAISIYPLVFFEEQAIDDCVHEVEINEESDKVDVVKMNLLVDQINEKLKGHSVFKDNFKHNLLKFKFLNKMDERKILSIFLCGDSGVGKTEFAKIASSVIYPNEPMIKINFGNYSTEGVLNSLIGSPLGYIGSEEGGELINKIAMSKSKIILIDEFERATSSVYNFFYELLEDGKFTDRHGTEHNLNGYIVVFTSNMTEKQYQKFIPNSLQSRFDMVYNFTDLPIEDKNVYIQSTANALIEKLKREFNVSVEINSITPSLDRLVEYKNLRDIKRKIEDIVFYEFFANYHSMILIDAVDLEINDNNE